MPVTPRLNSGLHLRPQRQALALEPRILFDGAAASAAADQHHSDPAEAAHPATDPGCHTRHSDRRPIRHRTGPLGRAQPAGDRQSHRKP
ncbi:LEPR-XLL domain-containing protein [Pseudomonas putida]|uniref:LEPR-XLL domain-containing protein n=1 Tax=Pseudomonas putida TaxID=303 RepID=UPI003D96ECB3